MTKQKMLRAVSAVALGFTMVTGVGVAGASSNHWSHAPKGDSSVVENNNNVAASNVNTQTAITGEAVVSAGEQHDNYKKHWSHDSDDSDPVVLGDATTGNASNENTTDISVDITNANCGCTTVSESDSEGSSSFMVTNNNNVAVSNVNTQTAISGNATVTGGNNGSATTGNASNMNTTGIHISIGN